MEENNSPAARVFGYFIYLLLFGGPGVFMWIYTGSFAAGFATGVTLFVLVALADWAR